MQTVPLNSITPLYSAPSSTTSMVVDKRLDISDNFLYGDVDQQLIYVEIYKQFCDL